MGSRDPEVVAEARRHDRLRDVHGWLTDFLTTPDARHAADLLRAAERAMSRHLACEQTEIGLLAAVVIAHVADLDNDILNDLRVAIEKLGVRDGK